MWINVTAENEIVDSEKSDMGRKVIPTSEMYYNGGSYKTLICFFKMPSLLKYYFALVGNVAIFCALLSSTSLKKQI